MKQLLPNHQLLVEHAKRRRTLFYFFKLNENADGNILKRKFQGFGAICLHWWQCEYTFIGEGNDHWTHAAVFQFSSLETLELASKSGLSSNEVEDFQLYAAQPSMPPNFLLGLFKLLRPVGWLYSRKHKELTTEELDEAFGQSKIGPTRNQINKHLANTRTTNAFMINMLQVHKEAKYLETDEEKSPNVSGGTAYYRRYGLVAMRSVIMMGGDLAFSAWLGEPLLQGNAPKSTAGKWTSVGVMRYPNPSKIFQLENMPGYRNVLKHRTAGLERTSLIIAKQ